MIRSSSAGMTRSGAASLVTLLLVSTSTMLAQQTEADVALRFFQAGGAYCFRLASEGTDLSEETEWTIMMLTSVSNRKLALRVRDVEAGSSGLRGQELTETGIVVTSVWRRDRIRDEFFERFAQGIRDGKLRARVTRVAPPGLATMKPRDRAELYLKQTDRGLRVDFEKIPDLTTDEFLQFQTYVPD